MEKKSCRDLTPPSPVWGLSSETAILFRCLAGVTRFAQGLPVIRIPKQLCITFMRNNVIYFLSFCNDTVLVASPADWLLFQVPVPCLFPLIGISALMRCPAPLIQFFPTGLCRLPTCGPVLLSFTRQCVISLSVVKRYACNFQRAISDHP